MQKSYLLCLLFVFNIIVFKATGQTQILFDNFRKDERTSINTKFTSSSKTQIDIASIHQALSAGERRLSVQVGEENWRFELTENSLIAPDYFVTIAGKNGQTVLKEHTVKTFDGVMEGRSGHISLTIDKDFINALISTGKEEYFIEQAWLFDPESSKDEVLIYNSRDAITDGTFTCGVTDLHRVDTESNDKLEERFVNQCLVVQLAIASDALMYAKYGNSAVNVQNHNIAVMNNVAFNYRHEFIENIEYTIVTQYVSTDQANDPLSPLTTSTDPNTVLPNFRTWGNNGGFGTSYDLAQFWTDRDFDGSTVGLAYVGVVCNVSRYHILQDFSASATSLRVMTAHEIGHNFGASHDASGAPYIMAPSVGTSNEWSSDSRSVMSNHISSRTCLSNCTGTVAASFVVSPGAVCDNGTVTYKDKSINGSTRSWTFNGGSPAGGTDQQPTVTYNTPGTFSTTITTNGTTSYTVSNAVIVDGTPPLNTASCPIPGGTPGTAGLQGLSLNGLNNTSGVGDVDGSIYVDRSCTDIVTLAPSTEYPVSVIVGNCSTPLFESIRIYIDYNNDGDFGDAGEVAVTSGSTSWCGTVSFSFTTPANPTFNQLLRMRVITSTSAITGPCFAPANGQVEDFSVVIKQSIPLAVDLISFSGYHETAGNKLMWSSRDEASMDKYVVERSYDGKNFNTIGFVYARNAAAANYIFEDKDISGTGILYYRLRMEERSGMISYSNVVAINREGKDLIIERLTTVVGRNTPLSLDITSGTAQPVDLSIRNMIGEVILKHRVLLESGLNHMDLSFDGLTQGIYILSVSGQKGIASSHKIIVGE